jgi:hypothetical protein
MGNIEVARTLRSTTIDPKKEKGNKRQQKTIKETKHIEKEKD